MRGVRYGLACSPPSDTLVCRLRRVRDVTRSKPRPEAVGGSRKSAGEVDESETGSANERASFGRLFHIPDEVLRTSPGGRRRAFGARAVRPSRTAGGAGFVELACLASAHAFHRQGCSSVSLGARVLSLPLVRDARRRRLGPHVVRSRTCRQRADLSLRQDPRRRRPRSAASLASLSGSVQKRSVLRDAPRSRLRARTSKPASTSPTLSSRRSCADSTGSSHVRARTCARRRLSPLAADVSSSRLTVAQWSSAQPMEASIPRT